MMRPPSGPALWSRAAWGGGILVPAAGIAGGVSLVAPALLEGDVPPGVAALASAAGSYGVGVSGSLAAIPMGAAAVVILGTGTLWR